ncbi:MAG: hypothetical protein IJX76_07135 [Clostridia bacterium]|nr:hypothetical protein [Clostridia bacterium]
MAAVDTISVHAGYRTAEGKHHVTVEMERKKVAYTLIALENLRFDKIDTVLLKDAALPIAGKLKKDGNSYVLSFMGKAIPLTEEQILYVLSLLLDTLNGTAGANKKYEFDFPKLTLTVTVGE